MTGTGAGRGGRLLGRLRPVAAVLLAGAVVAGCTDAGGRSQDPSGAPTTLPPLPPPTADGATGGTGAVAGGGEGGSTHDPATDPAYARFYDQEPAWEGCGPGTECTAVTVPVDWADPDGETLDLAVVRRRTDGDAVGALFMNPGGPGASGVEYVGDYGDLVTTRDLRDAYDLVGFDPRGVGASEPIDCLDDAQLDAFLAAEVDPTTPEGLAAMRADAEELGRACAADAGELLGHVDTVSAARDLDVLRAALDQERLHYLGKSYGTLLGATYADLYPGRVGRMVLDGALDPAQSFTDVSIGQAEGMERALRAYAEDCGSRSDCPLRGDLDERLDQVRQVLEDAEQQPLRTGDPQRPLTASLAFYGLIAALYDPESWPVLDQALGQALAGDGAGLLALADVYAGREEDGSYGSNLLEVFNAVNCLDYPVDADPESMAATAQRLEEVSPTFGEALAYGEVLCDAWPVEAVREPAPVQASGAPPILVVGTTGDPATPHAWAVALAEQLDSGRLLTYEGEGHTAYMRGSACVDRAVDRYLIDGVLPGEGATCG